MYRSAPIVSLVLAMLGCRPAAQTLTPQDPVELLDAARAPQTLGAVVYRGTVFARGAAPAAAPLFRYERRVREDSHGLVSTHLTLDGRGDPLIVHRATHDSDYRLRRFEMYQAQTGATGSVVVRDGTATFSVTRDGVAKARTERVDAPVVVGPTLFGAVLSQWDELVGGASVRVRFADVERMRTFAFDVRLLGRDNGLTTFSLVASSALVRMAVPDMRLAFNTTTRSIVRYEGPVPPMVRRGRRLVRLDATVDYQVVARRYR